MEIIINTEEGKTTIKIKEEDSLKLIDTIYWFLRDNKIIPTIEIENI